MILFQLTHLLFPLQLDFKVQEVFHILKFVCVEKQEKIVIASNFVRYLRWVDKALMKNKELRYLARSAAWYTGEQNVLQKRYNLDKFQDPESDCRLIYITMEAGGVGIGLQAACHQV